ncbi:catalase family peroxidase [Mycobacterium hodleri]|uniref:catalase family peroxidase n=1 Tax=Mycolicibacterium hodleri TaxID=49897 RepID=UPI0021F2BCE9|nr:catalase family peroxidase [Mycolicibacterium hodleri]MCV7132009.1 catalase family peroxidase [Mycolicibacterium hodleri]
MPGPRLNRRDALLGLAAAGTVLAVGAGGLAEASGWLNTRRLTSSRFADRFEQVYGRHNGFRRNHAKGLAATGTFTSNGAGAELSKASVFAPGTVPVTARFSLGGTVPDAADQPGAVRGLGLVFRLPHGEQWRTAMINLPVFPDSTPQGFYDRLLAGKPDPATGQPDPSVMKAFLAEHPETAAAMTIIKASPPSPGVADSTFHGLNAFIATNGAGASVPVRWAAVPMDPPGAASPTPGGRDYLFDDLVERMHRGPVSWRLVLTVAEPGDPTHDATLPWPAGRRTVDAGVITVDAVLTEAAGNARDVNFDPLVLPDGLSPSDDPLPQARSAVYARSFERRTREPKSPSAVDVERVNRDS